MAEEQERTIRGTVTGLFCQHPGFCAGRLRPARSDVARDGEIRFAGKVYVREGEAVALRGRWVDHEKFGRQFEASERLVEESCTPDALAAWLRVHGDADGIGPSRAAKIAREFGDNFAGWLRDDPEQVAITAGVPLDTVRRLAESWGRQEQMNRVGLGLAKYELTANQIHALYEKFKGSVVAILEENPYLLVGEVPGLGFRRVDEIARKVGVPPGHPGRLDAALAFCLSEAAEGEGSTCLEAGELAGRAADCLGEELDAAFAEAAASRAAGLAAAGKLSAADGGGARFYALPRHHRHERAVASFLASANAGGPRGDGGASRALASPCCGGLDESQARAVATALRNRASLVSGGAGSGKTFVVRAVANALREQGRTVALCAPTGKAARRLEEVVSGFEASTIHRLLEYRRSLGGFQRNPDNPLDADAVIVDEFSMVDAELAFHLLQAVGPGAKVVLVGDHHQLPPVGPGALLRDCIRHELLPLALLNQCHRQAGALKRNCQAVLRGEVPDTEPAPPGEPGPWYVHRGLHTQADVASYAERLFAETLPGRLGYCVARDVQFLTAQHKGPLGTRALNALFQRLHQRSLGVEVPRRDDPEARPPLLAGDKVIQTRNNYDLDVMNGHQGVVLTASPLAVRFGDRDVEVPKDCVGDVELAYCLTPHKCQGSEFPCVVVVAHKANAFMMHRNWLYTAVTRARRTCVVLGDPDGVARAARRVVNNQRRTLLPLLAAAAEAGAGACGGRG